ncbi:replication-associated recombination protein A [Myxococcota bacterium]|nr:replication-associated recombination protein A [Myxococcota bacterium]MCZ7619434.1 replication-associated recombination protein A [Myxococcota bacterium]
MRPRHLDEVVGQRELIGPGAPLRVLAETGVLPSLLLWGPPGCGKTTLAQLLAGDPARARFVALSAVVAGLKDVRAVVEQAAHEARAGRRTVLFLDEIHRFNRSQQDALLPHVERGTVTLIGATTENPSFEVITPLLSRCRVFVLQPLTREDLLLLLRRTLGDGERGLAKQAPAVQEDALLAIAEVAEGDARRALGLLEAAVDLIRGRDGEGHSLDVETVRAAAGQRLLVHDRNRDAHYDVVSAFIKSLRASDPDAALYWGARMLEAGEDPRFLTRRLMIFASEDIGNAEPQALPLALAAAQAVERVGMPEARIPLGQAIAFLACAPKSNACHRAFDAALDTVRRTGSPPVPLHLRNAPTALLRELGHGRDYRSPHATADSFVAAENLPEALRGSRFYEPKEVGAEAVIAQRVADWRRRREADE